jgi:hypothetical protein
MSGTNKYKESLKKKIDAIDPTVYSILMSQSFLQVLYSLLSTNILTFYHRINGSEPNSPVLILILKLHCYEGKFNI